VATIGTAVRRRGDHQCARRCVEAAWGPASRLAGHPEKQWRTIQKHRTPLAAE